MSETLFRSVDQARFAAALVDKLRGAGIPVGLACVNRFSEGLQCCPPTDVATLYWVARTTLIHDRRDFEAFDELFGVVFGGLGLPIAPWERQTGRVMAKRTGAVTKQSVPTDGLAAIAGSTTTLRPEIVDDADDGDDDDVELPELLPASVSALADTPFEQLGAADLDLVGRWLQEVMADLPKRVSRRHRTATTGGIDLRRTLQQARTSGEVITLARRRPRRVPRPVVMVADVSGSMESYSRVYLHVMRALVVAGRAEVFTFATSLRRVTVQLRERDAQAAIDRLSDEVSDRFGGTRIAASLGQLITAPTWSQSVRGATVIIASDGWDTDPPAELQRRMQRLQRLAYRVIWVNPRSAATDYQPTVAGMAAAMPYIDVMFSGHSLRAMQQVLQAMAGQLPTDPLPTDPLPNGAVRAEGT